MTKLAQFYFVLLLAVSLVGFSVSQSSLPMTSPFPVPQPGSDSSLSLPTPVPTSGSTPTYSPTNRSPSPSPPLPPLAPGSSPTPTSAQTVDDAAVGAVNGKDSFDSNHSSGGGMSSGKKVSIVLGVYPL